MPLPIAASLKVPLQVPMREGLTHVARHATGRPQDQQDLDLSLPSTEGGRMTSGGRVAEEEGEEEVVCEVTGTRE